MKNCIGSVMLLCALSAGYGLLNTVPVVSKRWMTLRTVETLTHTFSAIFAIL